MSMFNKFQVFNIFSECFYHWLCRLKFSDFHVRFDNTNERLQQYYVEKYNFRLLRNAATFLAELFHIKELHDRIAVDYSTLNSYR